tara:strand:+ start:1666 stop:1998 length:333 start_codon:yes stop_codon:yes gene_type:complete
MDDLPEDIVEYIYKIYFKKIVLQELLTIDPPKMCLNCCYHGLPCANCYDNKYEGILGPGHYCGKRFVHILEINNETLINILKWAIKKPYHKFSNEYQISKHVNLPQHSPS